MAELFDNVKPILMPTIVMPKVSENILIDCEEEQEEKFDSPQGSVWIVAVDIFGVATILQAPNIHYGFFDAGNSAEEIGLPFETDNEPGIYKWTCNCHGGRDDYTGEYWGPEFEVIKEELLWTPEGK